MSFFEKSPAVKALEIEANMLKNMMELVRPIISAYKTMLDAVGSGIYMSEVVRKNWEHALGQKAAEMKGEHTTALGAKLLSPIMKGVWSASLDAYQTADLLFNCCKDGKFQTRFQANDTVELFGKIKAKALSNMDMLEEQFRQVAPDELRDKVLSHMKRGFTNEFRGWVEKRQKEMEKKLGRAA
ncbi:hypothetical protein HY772_06325 [Candidatus Woesearchaeota archaeon]|nr:hypothetical protein [Candidatus Woesearchaeota archaeon]